MTESDAGKIQLDSRIGDRPGQLPAAARQALSAEGDILAPIDSESEGAIPSDDENNGLQEQAKSAFYDYASEKSLSHEESKLFYQRRHEARPYESDIAGHLNRARTFSLNYDGGSSGFGREPYRPGDIHNKAQCQRGLSGDEDPVSELEEDVKTLGMKHAGLHDQQHHPGTALNSLDRSSGAATKSDDLNTEVHVRHESNIHPELHDMSKEIKKILDLRHRYIALSLQGPNDNPKDQADWEVYPEPPKPVWTEDRALPANLGSGIHKMNGSAPFAVDQEQPLNHSQPPLTSVVEEDTHPRPASPPRKQRKPGQDIGSDFDMSHFEPLPGDDGTMLFALDEGSVYQVYESAQAMEANQPLVQVPTLREYYMDINVVKEVSEDGPIKSFAFRELQILDGKFNLHALENSYAEMMESKSVPHRDFYNVRKVDTHVHHSASMNSKHLLRFIKSKLKKSGSDVVMFRDGKEMTLREVFNSLNMTAYELSIDTLDTHAHTDSFHRFDKFNLKYNPVGSSRLREIFLKTDNYIQGRYLAELTREVISDLENSKYQMVEWRLSIYGRTLDEWDRLAAWVIDNKLISHNVRWLIQIPRLYSLYKKQGIIENFEQLIINIFQPLYQVTQNPSSHPKLHAFLDRVIGFDSVDDESKVERRYYRKFPTPSNWNSPENPMYNYWIYYLWANMVPLNHWRKRRRLGTFVLRPHCGEAGDVEHLQSAVLCCHSISHGLLLRKASLLQYIFYLDQIGIAMSPLSNNALFLAYDRNPFPVYFRRGLNVSLSTDDPLQFAYTKEPLIEEYSVAAQICKLSGVDMCELAQHSVMQSGFEHELKQRWLGPDYKRPGVHGNNVAKTNVPNLREEFRHNTLRHERDMIERYAAAIPPQYSAPTPLHPDPTTTPVRGSNHTRGTSQMHSAPAAHSLPNHPKSELKVPGTLTEQRTDPNSSRAWDVGSLPASSTTTTGHREPSIFPGVVRQRTRRRSVRQSSGSENDLDASGGSGVGLSRSGILEGMKESGDCRS